MKNIISEEEQEKIYKNYIIEHYRTEIEMHRNEDCDCDLTEAGSGMCGIGAWLEGLITSEDFLRAKGEIIGEILDDGTINKVFFRQGYVYKNYPNFWAKKGICYISENQGHKKFIAELDKDGKEIKGEFGTKGFNVYVLDEESKDGFEYETYDSILTSAEDAFEIQKIKATEKEIEQFAAELFEDVDWQFIDSLKDEYIENWEE